MFQEGQTGKDGVNLEACRQDTHLATPLGSCTLSPPPAWHGRVEPRIGQRLGTLSLSLALSLPTDE
ncbi:hypothetical protein CGRA01v4_00798 [Colletotrichum graminicola]|nr:hypothetical protein CGRA01v4_00798 [Colletotrichum graminicola]